MTKVSLNMRHIRPAITSTMVDGMLILDLVMLTCLYQGSGWVDVYMYLCGKVEAIGHEKNDKMMCTLIRNRASKGR